MKLFIIISALVIALLIGIKILSASSTQTDNQALSLPTPTIAPTLIPSPTIDQNYQQAKANIVYNCMGQAGYHWTNLIKVAQETNQDTPENLAYLQNLYHSWVDQCDQVVGLPPMY